MSQIKRLFLVFLILPALVAACGNKNATPNDDTNKDFFGDDLKDNTDKNIGDLIFSDSRFSNFADAMLSTNLINLVEQRGPFTVFVPTNAAFNRLPIRAKRTLQRNPRLFAVVLRHHIIDNELTAFDLQSMRRTRTLADAVLRFRGTNGATFVGNAQVLRADDFTENGVVHVIDEVLVPRRLWNQLGL